LSVNTLPTPAQAAKADKAAVQKEVDALLALKAEYKTLTGKDYAAPSPTGAPAPAAAAKKEEKKTADAPKKDAAAKKEDGKKETAAKKEGESDGKKSDKKAAASAGEAAAPTGGNSIIPDNVVLTNILSYPTYSLVYSIVICQCQA
jgi:hypothetical protein